MGVAAARDRQTAHEKKTVFSKKLILIMGFEFFFFSPRLVSVV
jgi:hypothetical protein